MSHFRKMCPRVPGWADMRGDQGVLCGGNVFGWEAWQRAKWFQRWRIRAFSHRPTGLRCSPSLETTGEGTEKLFACLYLWPQKGSWGRPEPRGTARSPGLQSVYTGVYMGAGEARGWAICSNQGVQQRPAVGTGSKTNPLLSSTVSISEGLKICGRDSTGRKEGGRKGLT